MSIEKPGPGIDPKLNGYSDYLFFQYLARTQGPDTIKRIFDAMAGGKNSVEAIAAAVDMKAVWPEFAKTLWIGFEDKVLDYWANEDEYRFGLAQVYAQVPTLLTIDQDIKDRQKSLEVDQKGQKSARFELLDNVLNFGGDYEIEPRSMLYEHLKFTDPTVHAVVFYNPIAGQPNNDFMKLQALKKIGGKWQAPEDWTNDTFKTWCLDKQDERLEELLIIVSNSQADRSSEMPFRIGQDSPMKVSTSNVGCWQWVGESSFTTRKVGAFTTVESAIVLFERDRKPSNDPADMLVGLDVFVPLTKPGMVNYSIHGPIGANCTISGMGVSPLYVPSVDGSLIVNYLLPGPLDRSAIGSGLTRLPAVTATITCPNGPPEKTTSYKDVHWLFLPPEGVQVSADGQSISGTWVRTEEGETKTSVWNFKSIRE